MNPTHVNEVTGRLSQPTVRPLLGTPPQPRKSGLCRCDLLTWREHDKTLLFRHCDKCEDKLTKPRERVGRSLVISLAKKKKEMALFSSLLVNVLATNLAHKAGQGERPAGHS